MAAFASVLFVLVFTLATWWMERTRRVSVRMSGLMLTLAGLALLTFAIVNLLLVEEPVHMLSGTLGTLIVIGGSWRLRRAHFGVERIVTPLADERPRDFRNSR